MTPGLEGLLLAYGQHLLGCAPLGPLGCTCGWEGLQARLSGLPPPSTHRREGSCSSCGKSVLWVATQRGKTMPVNAAPDPAGNIVIKGEETIVVATGQMAPWPRYVSHFATCPAAAKHRKASP